MKSKKITIDLAREDDIEKMLEINELEYGPNENHATYSDFAVWHKQNPAGKAIVPVIRDSSGSVVGFISVLPLDVRIRGQDRLAAVGTHLVIHPDYRKTFAYVKLLRRFERIFREHNIPLHYSFVSREKYRQVQNDNPQVTMMIPLLFKPLDFESLVQTYLTRGWQRFLVGRSGRIVSPFLFRRRKVTSSKEIAVQAIDEFNQDFDDFWYKIRDKYPAMVIRDRAFQTWRFAPVSGRHYHILVARSRGQMVGYVVLRCATIRGVKTGLIMDLLVIDGLSGDAAASSLMIETEKYFRAQERSLITGLMVPSAAEYRFIRNAGFIELPQSFAPRTFPFAFFTHDTSESNLVSLSAQDWFITLADFECS